tara:strand:- start:562 stop:1704 length:1143 start_codon:yes stop_codon:yes gene_type:complete
MKKMKFDHLTYYIKHKISPVGQNIFNKKKHFQRRESLYNHLGITKKTLSNLEILEVGPAEGHNAAYLASCNPKILHLVEPNPNANKNIFKIFKKLKVSIKKTKIIKQKFEDFNLKKKYDLVICEAWLGINKKERRLVAKLGTLVKNNGILIITSSSSISFLSNIIRRFIGLSLTAKITDFNKKTNYLVKFYKDHLKTMKNMSCPYKDWVQDCLIGAGFLNIHPNPQEIFKDLGKKFNFYNSYPKFYNDWRWYKDLINDQFDAKDNFLDQYNKNSHNFIDYKFLFPEIQTDQNIKLSYKSRELLNLLIQNENALNPKNYKLFLNKLVEINNLLKSNKIILKGIDEVIDILRKKNFLRVSKLKYFKANFGRELFYISLIKNL